MSQRDERIFPLCAPLTTLPKIGPKLASAFAGRGILRVIDLLMLLPRDGIDRTPSATVQGLDFPKTVTVPVTVLSHRAARHKNAPYRITVEDEVLTFQLVFFRVNEDYLKDVLPIGARRIVSGTAELYDNQVQITHPDYILQPDQALPKFEPVYPSVGGVSPRVIRTAVEAALTRVPTLEEWIPEAVMRGRDWPKWKEALHQVHNPKEIKDLALNTGARNRLAFDELFAHQVSLRLGRRALTREGGIAFELATADLERAKAALSFSLTSAQEQAVQDILSDLSAPLRMNRMVQGDVGSGKTAVAFLASAALASIGVQSVIMAPTEVLARQHADEFAKWCHPIGLNVGCLTGRVKGAERNAVLAGVQDGSLDILVGTHAVFESKVQFKNLGLAIIDEQHRFGVMQRKRLGEKGGSVDVLIMTATPIPRSLALTHFGDMDLSVLFEKPAGRQPIQTIILSESRLEEVIDRLRQAVSQGRQAYWVCPLVQDSLATDRTAVETRFTYLKKALGEDQVGMIHGQLPSDQKEKSLQAFVDGETSVLVATTVIEVGVNVPNATIIVIEGANGFGLAQLHQLRGRVGRSDKPSVCVLMYDQQMTKTAETRLRALRDSGDGFALAELDLKQRGAGNFLGAEQSGFPQFRIANAEAHENLIQIADDAAKYSLSLDPNLEGDVGKAIRLLLHLSDHETAVTLLNVG